MDRAFPPDLHETLFDRFTKSATSRGSGLGLAIAHAIVEAHGGSISVAPGRAGRGTTFRIDASAGRLTFRIMLPRAPIPLTLPRAA